VDLGPNHEIMTTTKSFAYCYKNGMPHGNMVSKNDSGDEGYYYAGYGKGMYWHPGYCWAATREAINTMGGLFDYGILGAGDHHMACALVGEAKRSIPAGIHPHYARLVYAWEERALRLHKNIGYVKGTIYHFWHGKKRDRKYKDRWAIMLENNVDPSVVVHKDWQGVWTLYPGHEKLRDQLRDYFQSRNEDSIDKE